MDILCSKRGLSQILAQTARLAAPTPVSRFICRRKSEADRQHLVLLAHRPGACETKAFAQPQHGLEAPDRPSCRVEGLKAADPRHRPFDPEDPMGVWLATFAPEE